MFQIVITKKLLNTVQSKTSVHLPGIDKFPVFMVLKDEFCKIKLQKLQFDASDLRQNKRKLL